ncbi:MAG: hypothetical protein JSW61_06010 [Candidatus Thorarchaeota archaeon]|nr:MAG: hypothetical protein JSW61_06010 [Candidatus Thorarchaeota archaeon]
MTRKWLSIAKAEFYVLTSSFRSHRTVTVASMYALAIVWAAYLAPTIMGFIIQSLIPMSQIRLLLMSMFPGLMRTVMLFLWILLLLYPLSFALQEIKIGQWEIFLSNNVRTKDIIIGTFAGKIPFYGLVVVILAPLMISPFMLAFEVSFLGQALVYSAIAAMVLSTIWLSNFVTALVQARLGDSPRGNDIAKALTFVIALIVIVPMYGVMFFMPVLSDILGMNAFLLMPFTWPADLVSWIAIAFNGIGLTGSQILGFGAILQLDMWTSLLLTAAFGLVWVPIALSAADRVFTISAGVRTETVTTVGRENFVIRGVRRAAKGSFGALTVVSLKDFGRKVQNISKILYGVVLAVVLPIIMSQIAVYDGDTVTAMDILPMIGIMIGVVGVFPFAGTGFLESKDQLWIIRSAPSGASRFMRARLASGFLLAFPLSLAPSVVVSVMFALEPLMALQMIASSYIIVCGAVMVSMGMTAQNPNYEDTKSPAHQSVLIGSMLLTQFTLIAPLFIDIFFSIALDVNIFRVIENIFGVDGFWFTQAIMGPVALLLMGGLMLFLGVRSLGKVEV